MMQKVNGYKTYIVGIVAIAYALAWHGWQQGDWDTAGQIILGALGLMGLRHGVANGNVGK